MKKEKFYILFVIATVVLLFMPAVQNLTGWFSYHPMNGETVKTQKPNLTYKNYVTGEYQNNIEQYISENFGFRPPLIRIYNQYLWDFYKKSYSDEVAIGKDNWLYFNFNVNEYYGKEMYRWVGKDTAIPRFTKQMRILNKLRGVLSSLGIEFMVFTTPDKADLYPQYLPDRDFDTTTIHAYDYYREAFAQCDFPYIDMNAWLKTIQDTLDFPAIPQASAHWVFPAVYAADSLFRFMAKQKGVVMPQIKIGEKIDNSKETTNVIRDLEYGLNLWRPIKLSDYEYYEREVTVKTDTNAVKMNVIFVGNSFFRAFNQYIPLDEIFSDVRYWFYNKTEFYGPKLIKQRPVKDIDRLYEIINADYILWFTDNAQMYKISYEFAEDALIKLCVSDSLWNAETERLMENNNLTRNEAEYVLRHDPEKITGLDGDGVPVIRNIKGIEKAKAIHKIVEEIKESPYLMKMIEDKAKEKNQDFETTLYQDAKWLVEKQEKEQAEFSYPSSKIWKHGVYSKFDAAKYEYVFDGLEVDIVFSTEKDNLFIGRVEEDANKNESFDDWLAMLENPAKLKYWIDFKNLSAVNCEKALASLDKLASKYGIKNNMMVESQDVEALKYAKISGFYVILWVDNLHYWRGPHTKNDSISICKIIRNKINKLHPDAISSEFTAYPMLCDSFPEENIHFWDTPKDFTEENIQHTQMMCREKSVKVVLVDYPQPIAY